MLLLAYIKELKMMEDGKLWIDENFDKKLKEINEKTAFISPLPGYNSVAQVVAHLTAWRKSVLSILNGGKRTLTMKDPENWPANELLKEKGWEQLKKELYSSQQDLVHLLDTKDDSFLSQSAKGTHETYDYYIRGLIHHDMYHLGQIGLIVKMVKSMPFNKERPLEHSTL